MIKKKGRFNLPILIVLTVASIGAVLGFGVKAGNRNSVLATAAATPPANHIESKPKAKMTETKRQTKLYPVTPSDWGARSVSFVIEKDAVKIEYDCAEGEIPGGLMIDKKGNFDVIGTHTRHSFGPIRRDNMPQPEPARYEGKITGKVLKFKVTLVKTKEVIGEFTIERDKKPILTRCY